MRANHNWLLIALGFMAIGWSNAAHGQSAAEAAAAALRAPITDEEFRLALEPDVAAKVDAAIFQLWSPEYKQREDATNYLIEVGPGAFSMLRDAYHRLEDAEVRTRIERVVRTAYLNYYVLDRYGFLGVQLEMSGSRSTDPKLPDGAFGVRVNVVIQGTGAEKAGLRAEDVVIAIDGASLADLGISSVPKFSEGIRAHRPGTKMKLTVLRSTPTAPPRHEQVDVEPVVGRAPPDVAQRQTVQVTSELARLAGDRFELWWPRFFNPGNGKPEAARRVPRETLDSPDREQDPDR